MTGISDKYLKACETEVYDVKQIQILLKNEIDEFGSKEVARRIGVTIKYLQSIANGERPPFGKVLQYLGFESVILFRRTDGNEESS